MIKNLEPRESELERRGLIQKQPGISRLQLVPNASELETDEGADFFQRVILSYNMIHIYGNFLAKILSFLEFFGTFLFFFWEGKGALGPNSVKVEECSAHKCRIVSLHCDRSV